MEGDGREGVIDGGWKRERERGRQVARGGRVWEVVMKGGRKEGER